MSRVVNQRDDTAIFSFRKPISSIRQRISGQGHHLSSLLTDKLLLVSTLCPKSNPGCRTHHQPLQWPSYLVCFSATYSSTDLSQLTMPVESNIVANIGQQQAVQPRTFSLNGMLTTYFERLCQCIGLLIAANINTHLGPKNWQWQESQRVHKPKQTPSRDAQFNQHFISQHSFAFRTNRIIYRETLLLNPSVVARHKMVWRMSIIKTCTIKFVQLL